MQEVIAQLTKDLSGAQEKLLQAEQVSGQRLDELEALHAQLQVASIFSEALQPSQYVSALRDCLQRLHHALLLAILMAGLYCFRGHCCDKFYHACRRQMLRSRQLWHSYKPTPKRWMPKSKQRLPRQQGLTAVQRLIWELSMLSRYKAHCCCICKSQSHQRVES